MVINIFKRTKYIFFWDGIFSNWHESNFSFNNINYNCVEQYMMHQKAIFFNDIETSDKILKELYPRKQKQLGREVKNFNNDDWNVVKYEIVKNGIREKFNQNSELKNYLISFKNHIIVEASPEDRIWGIGFSEDDALQNIDKWGENLLGKILTELASEFAKNKYSNISKKRDTCKYFRFEVCLPFQNSFINFDKAIELIKKKRD